MAVDWMDQSRSDTLTFTMVNQTNINATKGELADVILDKSSVTAGYYTDTRTSGKLVVSDSKWARGSFIRITHSFSGYSNNIGTYIVTDDDWDLNHGVWEQTLTLNSILFGLSTDKLTGPYTIKKNAYGLAAIKSILSGRGRPALYNGALDYRYTGGNKVYETGTSVLSVLYDIASTSKNRIDVDGYGRVTVGKYIAPNSKSASLTIDVNSSNGVVHNDTLKLSTDWLEMPTNAVISYKYSDKKGNQKEIIGRASVSNSDHAATKQRGYTVTAFQSLSEMSPQNTTRANTLAKNLLTREGTELIEWKFTCQYLPIWQGHVVNLIVSDGPNGYKGTRKCLVKNVDIDFGTMTMDVTLKETRSGDYSDD